MTDSPRERLAAVRRDAIERLASLEAQLDDIAEARRGANSDDEHDPEGSTLAFDRAQAAVLAADSRHVIEEVDAAVGRLDAGTYGVCERCGRPIGAARLELRPTARLCVTCQAQAERRSG
ncbi:hypothetical protein GCM10025864_19020 [Luteimicrobium album]|uniref:Zinc finger DksA/TraR C4-type domain-containing protein n=1 Tax=Luteimicrobium album TaxID=1054550 RepID=A0ABQ6I2H8_9MICO|nr:TraR/DksA family transcriptional regulator [Luteimicrobium album]GMA24143.1 hypothetical protein GCM10025864_19020 [Luteimicrobium album]